MMCFLDGELQHSVTHEQSENSTDMGLLNEVQLLASKAVEVKLSCCAMQVTMGRGCIAPNHFGHQH
jgi:hypothetical protein